MTRHVLSGATVAPQQIADTSKRREVIVGLAAEGRDQVDDLADQALVAGGESPGGVGDQGFMYMRGFRDLDGHQWSFIHMDLAAIAEEP